MGKLRTLFAATLGLAVGAGLAPLAPAAQADLERDLRALIGQFNRSGDSSMVVPGEYLEIVVTRH